MNWKTMIAVVMVVGLLLAGCASSSAPPTGYYSYGQQGAQPQGGQYAGGGCGLAANDAGTPAVNAEIAEMQGNTNSF